MRIALLALVSVASFAQVVPDITGVWFVADSGDALVDNDNPRSFTISSVKAQPAQYYDGTFAWRWEGDPLESKGYYSNKTGRVWFNTERLVRGRTVKVQYSGRLADRKPPQIQGSAGATGTTRLEWHFTATKQERKR